MNVQSSVFVRIISLRAGSCDSDWLVLLLCDDRSAEAHISSPRCFPPLPPCYVSSKWQEMTSHPVRVSIQLERFLSPPAKEKVKAINDTSNDPCAVKIRTQICLLFPNWATESTLHFICNPSQDGHHHLTPLQQFEIQMLNSKPLCKSHLSR